ncbi:GNAT family N-acetyltransferase [Gallaecimonas kandeliae]|uniref:N-acyl amino acid synthase FeeM domain-containing protein n=1 Tax=Gallaecimonas kandeliae TaxID=3029055 RepID=UPI00264844A7|nr:GNAT family N-acyltransferase [Gallaecimonas kandeliae]WKE66331.1 GNAT family N-acetyltransferase [Gallaecimonas kandeliae]
MPLIIKTADSPELLDEIYRLRHRVFCEEEGCMEATADGRIQDRFDASPFSHQLVVLVGGKVVGAMRITEDSPAGMPADDYFPFRALVPQGSILVSGGMLCIERAFRGPRTAIGLTLMSTYLAVSKGMDHIAAPINPAAARFFKRIGFRQLGEATFAPHMKGPFLPMLLARDELNDFVKGFIRLNERHNPLGSTECHFYTDGDPIALRAETPGRAWLVVDGAVALLDAAGRHTATLGAGERIGGQADSLLAKGETKLMVIKDAMQPHPAERPKGAANKEALAKELSAAEMV